MLTWNETKRFMENIEEPQICPDCNKQTGENKIVWIGGKPYWYCGDFHCRAEWKQEAKSQSPEYKRKK